MDAGGVAHVVHKTVQPAAERLAIDGRVIAGKIYTHLHSSSGRLGWSRACREIAENSPPKKAPGHPAPGAGCSRQTCSKENRASSRICCAFPCQREKYS